MFTAESVTIGHPDKLCDQIADSILTAYLKLDENSRVACEVCAYSKGILVMGEITSKAEIDIEKIVRDTIINIGYNNDELGFNGNNCEIIIKMNKQSSDIALGVDKDGAGDQGLMFGYATNETDNYMPYPIYFANKLCERLEYVRKNNIISYLRPDGKAEVTLSYNPLKIHSIVISTQHDEVDIEILRSDIKKYVIDEIFKEELIKDANIYINPTGRFVIGGPVGDSGLTGRKIIVDSYGSAAHHGGGAYSGKDYTKVDRSAAYYARYVAKNIVASGLCDKIEICVSYAIGVSKPTSISINTFNTNKIEDIKILEMINKVFDFSPKNIINELDLKHIDYTKTTNYSHFGKNELSYEQLNKVDIIKSMI